MLFWFQQNLEGRKINSPPPPTLPCTCSMAMEVGVGLVGPTSSFHGLSTYCFDACLLAPCKGGQVMHWPRELECDGFKFKWADAETQKNQPFGLALFEDVLPFFIVLNRNQEENGEGG